MSKWVYVVGTIEVETYNHSKKPKKYLKNLIKDAPKITGSEGPVEVFVNIPSGHSVSITGDCASCPHGKLKGLKMKCKAKNGDQCTTGYYQTKAIISLYGNLRDREIKQTEEEYSAFMRFLEKDCGLGIDNVALNISKS